MHDEGRFGRGDLIDTIIADIRAQTGVAVLTTDFKVETLPAHHFMNFKVVDEHGRQLDMGRNLAALQAEGELQTALTDLEKAIGAPLER